MKNEGEIRNPYKLYFEFPDEKDMTSYLGAVGFLRDKEVKSYWKNQKTGVIAHTCSVNELGGARSWLATYYSRETEVLTDIMPKPKKDILGIGLAKGGVHYGG